MLEAWQGLWQEVVANRVLSSPVTVFAGLGSPTGVLIDTTKQIRAAIPGGTKVYQVDPGERNASRFFAEVQIPAEHYLQMPWGRFMEELSERLLRQHLDDLVQRCHERILVEGLEQENSEDICSRLMRLGFLAAGRVRARWLLESIEYMPVVRVELAWVADLVLAVALVERKTGTVATFRDDGIVELFCGGQIVAALIIAHGRGSRRWLSMEPTLHTLASEYRKRYSFVPVSLVAGVQGSHKPEVSPPANIVPTADPTSILPRENISVIIEVEELRLDDSAATRLVPHE